MKLPSNASLSRRNFLTSTAGAGGLLFSGGNVLFAAPGEIAETDHFWYRLAPADGPYIDTQRGSDAFGFRDGKIFLSEDNGKTWPHQNDFEDAENIMFSSILRNGNIVFATLTKIYLSDDRLKSYREIIVQDRNGNDYLPHTPKNPLLPGSYFYSLDGVHTHDVEGQEMLIWGNYCNVRTGAVPVNIFYSTDHGETIKLAYSFGQNSAFQEKGADPADYLGAPGNPLVCRHIHSVSYNPEENAFWACTGDLNRKNGHGDECHWLRGTYDKEADHWEWNVQVSSDANSRFKSGGINFVDGEVYWVADANGPKTIRETYDRGVFKCDPADIAKKEKHIMLFPAQYEIAVMTIEDEHIVIPEYGNANPCDCGILYSPDLGKSWGQYDLKEFGDRSGVRVNPRNSDGWFRMCLREKWMNRAEVLFIKPKSTPA
ncbi:MAG: hypothetical protein P1U86_03580 [Verrucomicrobiales bacterium]|nr:hypothetical protein [Verrucomicrobiales bacterium]